MESTCPECNFEPLPSLEAILAFFSQAVLDLANAAISATPSNTLPERWNAAQYLWHVVDVLRFGTERIITITVDPTAGAMPWDADEMMEARSRSPHSIPVGVEALDAAATQWLDAARVAPINGTTQHPQLGTISLLTSLNRNAHEVVHHTLDIRNAS